MTERNVDKEWFLQRINDKCGSLRGFAKLMQIDVSAASRMFSGQREITLAEAAAISTLLELSLDEITERAGIATGARPALKQKAGRR